MMRLTGTDALRQNSISPRKADTLGNLAAATPPSQKLFAREAEECCSSAKLITSW